MRLLPVKNKGHASAWPFFLPAQPSPGCFVQFCCGFLPKIHVISRSGLHAPIYPDYHADLISCRHSLISGYSVKSNRLFVVGMSLFLSFGSLLFDLRSAEAQGYFLQNRWSRTATDGSGLSRGQATTLTWGIIDDGTAITRSGSIASETNDPSSLINFLDTNIGAGGGGSDLTNRPWFRLFEESYNRWGEVSGLEFNYEANDNGDDIRDFPPGVLNSVADMRIGGHSIDGQTGGNVLAYNYYPNAGDMVIDTDNVSFFSNGNSDYLRLRNTIMHEVGHGIGIRHVESDDARFLMEPSINLNFEGPQFADILAAHRYYGDQNEEGTENETAGTATELVLENDREALIGEDARGTVVASDAVDFVSIDGDNDTDYFSFEITEDRNVLIELTPEGPTYRARAQGASTYNEFDSAAQNDLILTLYDTDGTTILNLANDFGLGGLERIRRTLAAGTYFIRVTGTQDEAQFYSLRVVAIPEPAMIVALSVLCCGAYFYLRRKKKIVALGTANFP